MAKPTKITMRVEAHGTVGLTGVDRELDEARKWQVRQHGKVGYWKLKRLIAAHGLLAVYRDWKAGRRPG